MTDDELRPRTFDERIADMGRRIGALEEQVSRMQADRTWMVRGVATAVITAIGAIAGFGDRWWGG